jgi:hypothetical protein
MAAAKSQEPAPAEAPAEASAEWVAPFGFVVLMPAIALHFAAEAGIPASDDVVALGATVTPASESQLAHLRLLEGAGHVRAVPLV